MKKDWIYFNVICDEFQLTDSFVYRIKTTYANLNNNPIQKD
jgi:hypothetical protein